MLPSWTKEQADAISAGYNNLLITASAGSGKTAVLVERIIRLVCREKVDLDRLLIVTFTNAAAAEMRHRISLALLAELDKNEGNAEHLRRQLNLLSHSSISTLHSFCSEIVRKHFYLLDIDPNFRIGNTTETELIKLELIEDFFEDQYDKASQYFLGMVEMFGSNMNDQPFQDLFLRIYEFIQSQPYPLDWFRDKVKDFELDEENFKTSHWIVTLSRELQIKLKAARDIFEQALQICQRPRGPAEYQGAIMGDLKLVEHLLHALNLGIERFHTLLKESKHQKLARISKAADVDSLLQDKVKELRDDGKKLLGDIRDSMPRRPYEYLEDLHKLHPFMDYLADLLSDFSRLYQDKKAEKGILDFNDLEHMALRVLNHEQVAAEYRDQYLFIFVDEYQDSNLVQETLLDFIKRDDNLFLVGDVKQSIYRFRLADPSLFIQKREIYKKEEDALYRRIDLNKNFRSNTSIIDGVNYIFRRIMSREFGEIDYDEDAFLYPGPENDAGGLPERQIESDSQDYRTPYVSLEPELYIIENNQALRDEFMISNSNEKNEEEAPYNEDSSGEQEDLADSELEARLAAKRIKDLCQSFIYDKGSQCFRQVEYRDIVVLMRANRNASAVVLEHFLHEGIPAYADIERGYFESLEIELFINLLRLIDNQEQDIPLLSVLRSPIAGFSIEELISIRLESPGGQSRNIAFYEALKNYADSQLNELADKIRVFQEQLKEWEAEAIYMRMDEFIWKLFLDTGYYYYVGAMPGGPQRQANLRILYDRARQFQTTSTRGLFSFIRFIERLRASQGDLGSAVIMGEQDNVVRIMSIHKSKGLEFPIVILAGMGKRFNLRDTSSPMLLHRDLGLGPRYVDMIRRTRQETIARQVIKNAIRMENLAEEMRILYVAMTRPQQKLIMLGSVRSLESCRRRWSKAMNPYNLSKCSSYLDWIGSALLRHSDGKELRCLDGEVFDSSSFCDDQSRWIINLTDSITLAGKELARMQEAKELKERLEERQTSEYSETRTALWERLNWQYPNQDAALIPSKITITTLKNLENCKLENLRLNPEPEFTSTLLKEWKLQPARTISAAEKGTIIHFIMQHINYSRAGSEDFIREQIHTMVEQGMLTAEAASLVDAHKIVNFFTSSIGQRMVKADRVYREVPFNLQVQAGEVIKTVKSDETMLLQGVIDLYFEEDRQLVLVDYKSDWLLEGQEGELVDRYRTQLEWYKKALERIQGRRVKECYLYFFGIDRAILIE